ncbi:hypothetical protein [Actinoplanes sp. NPDC089786]|uniref:hypothetical protein n=1 Tax=Actinoplanes sp. NPDC089786 TaxID=3155185 RepID=UPI0034479809
MPVPLGRAENVDAAQQRGGQTFAGAHPDLQLLSPLRDLANALLEQASQAQIDAGELA